MPEQTTNLARQETKKRELDMATVSSMTGYSLEQIALITKTVAQGAPFIELATFLHACNKLELDPLLKQAYWIRRKGREKNAAGAWEDVYKGTLQVGIDGYRALADRQGNYAGSEAAEYRDWFELVEEGEKVMVPGYAQVRVWKVVQGRNAVFVGEARWTEFYPGAGGVGKMWRKMPTLMLAKCAEAQALRKGWPALLGSLEVMTDEGAQGAELAEVSRPRTVIQPAPPSQLEIDRLAAQHAQIWGTEDDDVMFRRTAPPEPRPPDPRPNPTPQPQPGPAEDEDDAQGADEEEGPAEPQAQPDAARVAILERYTQYMRASKRALGDKMNSADWLLRSDATIEEIERKGRALEALRESAGEQDNRARTAVRPPLEAEVPF